MFKNLSIKSRLTFVVGILSVLLLVIGIMGLVGMKKANEGLRAENDDLAVASDQIHQIENMILDEQLHLSLALLSHTPEEVKFHTGLVEMRIEQFSKNWQTIWRVIRRRQPGRRQTSLRRTMNAMSRKDCSPQCCF